MNRKIAGILWSFLAAVSVNPVAAQVTSPCHDAAFKLAVALPGVVYDRESNSAVMFKLQSSADVTQTFHCDFIDKTAVRSVWVGWGEESRVPFNTALRLALIIASRHTSDTADALKKLIDRCIKTATKRSKTEGSFQAVGGRTTMACDLSKGGRFGVNTMLTFYKREPDHRDD
jgi:hypothetical protein